MKIKTTYKKQVKTIRLEPYDTVKIIFKEVAKKWGITGSFSIALGGITFNEIHNNLTLKECRISNGSELMIYDIRDE